LIILGVSALVLLGYLVGLFGSKFDLRPRVERRFLARESQEEARARYTAAWKRYQRLRVAFPLVFLGCLPFVYIGGAVFRFFGWIANFLMMLALAWIPFMSIFSWQWAFSKCPRCDKAFKWIGDLFFPKHCH
jgi:hypothetical protein